MTIQTRWITSLETLSALGPRYDAMVLSAGDAGLFYQRGWLERAWPYYQARLGGTLAFLVAEQDGELVALAPLVMSTKGWTHARQRVLGFIGGTWDELDNWMPGFLFAPSLPDAQAEIMRALADAIARQDWDQLELRLLRTACPGPEALRARFVALRDVPDRLTTPRACVATGWAPYWAGRSKRLLRILERGRRRVAEEGLGMTHEVTADIPSERRLEVAAIHRARQDQLRATQRARSSPFEDPHAQQVFWSLIDFATAQGQLRAHWLRIDGRTAAYVIALHHAGTTFAYFNAFDPAAERYHPGSVVLAGVIEREATEYGAVVVDMMLGTNLTKQLLATEELGHTNLSVVNPSRRRSRVKAAWVQAAGALALRLRR